jgi:hypothetical protein
MCCRRASTSGSSALPNVPSSSSRASTRPTRLHSRIAGVFGWAVAQKDPSVVEDLERIRLRARRPHDTRRTFISIARADGARPDVLRWATHGPTGDIVDDYTMVAVVGPLRGVAKVRIRLLEGMLIELPRVAAAGGGFLDLASAATNRGARAGRGQAPPISIADVCRGQPAPLISLVPSLDRGQISDNADINPLVTQLVTVGQAAVTSAESGGVDGTRTLITTRTLVDTRDRTWLKSYRYVRTLTSLPDSRCHA